MDARQSVTRIVGERIRKACKENGLTQEKLAGSAFTKGYISALKRKAVRPSLDAQEHIASQLGLPILHFAMGIRLGVSPDHEGSALSEPDLDAPQEDLNYLYTFARMLAGTVTK